MAGPVALTLSNFCGVLELDDADAVSALRWTDPSGQSNEIVMMLDPSPTGAFDPSEVRAAYTYFAQKPGTVSGSVINVVGFVAVPPGANQPFLHVVRG